MEARILYANGSATLSLYWRQHKGTDVYGGWIETEKTSYHASGRVHTKVHQGGYSDAPQHFPPLKDLTGAFILGTLAFPNHPDWFAHDPFGSRPFKGRKADALLTIDSRTIPEYAMISMTIGLLEPVELESLNQVMRSGRCRGQGEDTKQVLMDVSVTPWIWAKIDVERGEPAERELFATQRWPPHAVTENLLKINPW